MSSAKLDFPVRTDSESDATFAGHLHRALGSRRGVLQVLVHGVSYDHRYWDAETINGTRYSFVDYMTERGYDVLAVDLPGTGDSTRPPGDSVGFDHVGEALSVAAVQVRDQLGRGDKIALIGHSLGTMVQVYTQAHWPVADFLVGTGVGFSSSLLPSPHGPGVREQALLDAYPLLPPEHRSKVFYHHPTADTAVIDYDNRVLRTAIPRRIWKDSIEVRDDKTRAGVGEIACPTLIQLGQFDPVLPGQYAEQERAQWPAPAEVSVESIEGMGHCLNLHRHPERGWQSIDRFLSS